MNKKLIDALDACLQKMDHGESLDSVLAGYPHLAAALRPLLITAVRARSASRESIPRTILLRQRSRGLALAEDLRRGKSTTRCIGVISARLWQSFQRYSFWL